MLVIVSTCAVLFIAFMAWVIAEQPLTKRKGTVPHALAADTVAEKCERLAWLSDERVYWETRRDAVQKAYELGCLQWDDT